MPPVSGGLHYGSAFRMPIANSRMAGSSECFWQSFASNRSKRGVVTTVKPSCLQAFAAPRLIGVLDPDDRDTVLLKDEVLVVEMGPFCQLAKVNARFGDRDAIDRDRGGFSQVLTPN